MAFLQAVVPWRTFALTGGTAAHAATIKSPANQCLKILSLWLSHDGATSTNAPDVTDLTRITTATAGTSSATTPGKNDPGRQETIQSTGATNYSAEPGVISVFKSLNVPQYMGVVISMIPFATPIIVAPGGTASLFGVRQNSPNNCNTSGSLEMEE